MKLIALVTLASCLLLASASRQVFEGKLSDPAWVHVGRAPPAHPIKLIFAVKQRNAAMLPSIVDQVSNPQSRSFGKHLSLGELRDLLSDFDATAKVVSFLKDNGVQYEQTINGEFVVARLSVLQAETLLGADMTEFHLYRSTQTDKVIARSAKFSLPKEVADAVDFVDHTNALPSAMAPKILVHGKAIQAGKPGDAYPSLLWKYYNVEGGVQSPAAGSSQSLFEAGGQNFEPSSLATFQSTYGVQKNPITKVVGPNSALTCVFQPNACAEASLDVQYITAIGQGIPTWYWAIDSSDQTPFIDWVVAVANSTNPPLVHSISYGEVEAASSVLDRFNTEVQKIATRGLSVFVSSGDDGVANFPARTDPSKCGFFPSFPASSEYVTAVGATQGPEDNKTEIACTSSTGGEITTGGGFSNVWATPSYQASAVQNYLKNASGTLPPAGQFNSSGRGYPDVSAMGHNYEIVINSQTYVGSGTSASSPVFAGMIALINDARLKAGKSALGFLNHALYQAPADTWNDITSGKNNCCAGPNPDCCEYGFTAAAGWDPLTGLGSPRFEKLKAYLMSL